MLLELHLKNFALIENADLEFNDGLTILSGETGAGKSILIDSINIALGAKTGKDAIRSGAEYAYIELVFQIMDNSKIEKIKALDIAINDDNILIITRKIMQNRSIMRVNDESITSGKLKELTGLLIDIHGQHEHQSLMHASKHLQFVDLMSPEKLVRYREKISVLFNRYNIIENMLADNMDVQMREREADILKYEIDEIEKSNIKKGEEEKIREIFTGYKNASKINENLSKAAEVLETDNLTHAIKSLHEVATYDKKLLSIEVQLIDIDNLLSDAKRSIADYTEDFSFDEEEYSIMEQRLDVINHIQDKYSDDINEIENICEQKKKRLELLENYDLERVKLEREKSDIELKLDALCDELSALRKKTAVRLREMVIEQLRDLNFLGVEFEVKFTKLEKYSASGTDAIEFLISTNPGMEVKPIREVASGGELSRIMLALKTVMADTDEIETLIFDEIDAGISGRTAQSVAEKLSIIGKKHQVICITHLPQIAAMADYHYLIEKETDSITTKTNIELIEGEDIYKELARLIGGSKITPAVLDTAREMKGLANSSK